MIWFRLFVASLFYWSTVASRRVAPQISQTVLPKGYQPYDEGLFTPTGDFSTLSDTEFSAISHPEFPRHRVRVKKSTFCDGTVNSYTGYIDIDARHLFFYFFESRGNPDKDDVIFWVNGGPGGSSAMGLFMELGPCRVVNSTSAKFHDESWNSNANIFFVDQPVGVGYSYADYGESVTTTEEAAKDIAAFVAIFFEHFSKLKGRAFHMASESYGGRYIPVFASEIYDQNKKLAKAGLAPINLTSIMIGNGDTDIYTMVPSYYDKACTAASEAPLLDISAAISFCEDQLYEPFEATGINPYDVTRECEGTPSDTACYFLNRHIQNYLNLPEIRSALGIDPGTPNITLISLKVNNDFVMNLDGSHPTYNHVAALLDRGVRVLIYVGRNDWICNHLGNEAWTTQFEWSGHVEFASQPLREWSVDGQKAGFTRKAKGLTYASVDGAGHMVPYDKPKEALELVSRWLNNQDL
ncbi:hypothetical protein CVT25_007608 [Psilocybe cyanescens]|uniref:Carboxypeptidase n=1 Tax=Psilocybe cyanescens TaxID=93625 RepID=A0A409X168_PSICY|nr:hypothetical protein CVT25_007608 [Psilocybe cyanescens]